MCSDTTKAVADQLVYYNSMDVAHEIEISMLYPLLDDIPDWMDDQYDVWTKSYEYRSFYRLNALTTNFKITKKVKQISIIQISI